MRKLLLALVAALGLSTVAMTTPVEAEVVEHVVHPEYLSSCKVTYVNKTYHIWNNGGWGYCHYGNQGYYAISRCYRDSNEGYIGSYRGAEVWPGTWQASYAYCPSWAHTHATWIVAS